MIEIFKLIAIYFFISYMSKEVKMSLKVDESIKTEKVYINTNLLDL